MLFLCCFFGTVGVKVWKCPHFDTTKLQHQTRQPRTPYMSTQTSTKAWPEKLALRRNYGSHNTDVYCSSTTPRITTVAGGPCLGFWGPPMSIKCDVAAFGWCRLALHQRTARFDSWEAHFALIQPAGGQMASGLFKGSVGNICNTTKNIDSKVLLFSAKLLWLDMNK